MTRKDYELIAGALNQHIRAYPADNMSIRVLASNMIVELFKDNKKFDSRKFADAVLNGVD